MIFFKLAVSFCLLLLAVELLEFDSIVFVLRSGSLNALGFALLISVSAFLVMAVRWYNLVPRAIGRALRPQLSLYLKATFLNTFTPANLGGDVYRLVVLRYETESAITVLRLLFQERLLGLYGFVTMFVGAYAGIVILGGGPPVTAEDPFVYGIVAALGVLMGLALARRFTGREGAPSIDPANLPIPKKLSTLMTELSGLVAPKKILLLMALTYLAIALWILSIHVIAKSYGLSVPVLQLAVVATQVELIRLIPVTVQGIGLREGSFAYFLSYFGHNPEQCFAVGLVAYLVLSLSILVCGPLGQALGWGLGKPR